MVQISDDYAPEHLEVQTKNLDWFHKRLKNYGSLFIGEETTVAYGDKCSGTNHILPTNGSAKYSSGMSVNEFCKRISYINLSKKGIESLGPSVITLANYEGLAAHAQSVKKRIRRK